MKDTHKSRTDSVEIESTPSQRQSVRHDSAPRRKVYDVPKLTQPGDMVALTGERSFVFS